MKLTIVVAMAENGVIGRDGVMPWRLSSDLRRFKASTLGKPVLMGRKTWESLPRRPLPGRRNIVISRDAGYTAADAEVAGSLDEALALVQGENEVCVIGGGEIYRAALARAERLDVTHVLDEIGGDTHFPVIDPGVWIAVESHDVPAGENDSHATRHVVYERR